MKEEIWKQIEGYEKLAEISSYGRIKILSNGNITNGHRNGNYLAWRYDYKKQLSFNIHRLVAKHFLPTPPSDCTHVHHKNGIKHVNRAINLEWINPSKHISEHIKKRMEGMEKMTHDEYTLYLSNKISKGLCFGFVDKNVKYKGITGQFTKNGELINTLKGTTEIEKAGFTHTHVYTCAKRKSKTHKKFVFRIFLKEYKDIVIGKIYDLESKEIFY